VLSRFLSGKLSPEETRAVVQHLVRGCEQCLELLKPEELPEESYELPIRRAFQAVRLHGPAAPQIKAAARKLHQRMVAEGWHTVPVDNQPDYAIFEALLQRAQELRHENPHEMVLCSFVAVITARRMEGYPSEHLADFNARALVEYANALRVADRLSQAAEQLDLAEQWFAAGTRDAVLGLRLQDVRASLYGSQQHYGAAIDLLDEVIRGRLQLGDRSGAARALIGQGVFAAFAGRLEEAFTHLDKALELVDSHGEPELVALARHNYIDFLVDAGRCAEALEILLAHRTDLLALGGRVNRWKLLGNEGRIYGGLGQLDVAESLLREARQGCLEAGAKKVGAVVTLELAAVVLRRSRIRYPEAVALAVQALQVFTQLQVKPQVIEALNVLADAIKQGLVTATFLQSVADFMHKAEHDRRARFEPRFE
jgi:tetratricopeptide (TPR) repeat protein